MPTKRETQLLERIQRMDGNIKNLRGVIKEQKTEIKRLFTMNTKLVKMAGATTKLNESMMSALEKYKRMNSKFLKTIH